VSPIGQKVISKHPDKTQNNVNIHWYRLEPKFEIPIILGFDFKYCFNELLPLKETIISSMAIF